MNRVKRVETEDNNLFEIHLDGRKTPFFCEREFLDNGQRGHWILRYETEACGVLDADRDQYSNDLMERIGIHLTERPIYDNKFRVPLSKAEYLKDAATYITELEHEFGGEWASDYYEWEGKAVFCRVFK